MRTIVYDTTEDLAAGAADRLTELLGDGPVTFGLAGGSSPVETYRILRERDLPWEQVTCWLPDERWVPADAPESNAMMARTELTNHIAASLLAPDTTLDDPAASAAAYQGILAAELGDAPGVVVLGIGADGHTASLFPDTVAIEASDPGYVANWVGTFGTWRLTATAPLLQAATTLIFLASGLAKAPVLRSILVDEQPYPAGVVAAGAADVTWLLDVAAATEL